MCPAPDPHPWQVGDFAHPKGARPCVCEEVVFVGDGVVVTRWPTPSGFTGSVTRALSEMGMFCEPCGKPSDWDGRCARMFE